MDKIPESQISYEDYIEQLSAMSDNDVVDLANRLALGMAITHKSKASIALKMLEIVQSKDAKTIRKMMIQLAKILFHENME